MVQAARHRAGRSRRRLLTACQTLAAIRRRKDITTGSLIATTKQCLKRSEWEMQQREARDKYEQLQGKDTIMQGN